MVQSKYWCLTLNNYTGDNVIKLKHWIRTYCSYGVIGFEGADDERTDHLQCYIEVKGNRKRMHTVKRLIDIPEIHFEKRAGSAMQASDYCKKEEDFWEFGVISNPSKGKRNDIHVIRDEINNGGITTIIDLIDNVSSVQSFTIGSRLLHIRGASSTREAPNVFWFYGRTGCGKTRQVYDWCRKMDFSLWKSAADGLKWFDGYAGQDIALFDDYRWDGKRRSYTKLLQLLDRYVAGVEFKGGSTWFTSKWIFITSPESPTDMFADLPARDPIDQLLRRINHGGGVYNFDLEDDKRSFNERIEQYMVVVESDIEE